MPTLSTTPDSFTSTRPQPASRLSAFPLMRGAPASRQIVGMLLYSLLMALSIVGCMLLYGVTSHSGGLLSILNVLSIFLLPVLIIPASTLLCGALFGSWRGTLVSFLSIGSGLLLSRLSNNTPQGLQEFLVPGLIATLIVGLIYDRRKYVNEAASFFIMLLGGTIAFCGYFFTFLVNGTVESGAFLGCVFFFLMGFGVFALVGLEVLLQRIIATRRQRREGETEGLRSNTFG